MKKKTTEEFIKESKIIHGDKYDYSETNYVNARTNVKIKCKLHGVFEQNPNNHLNGAGCPMCSGHSKDSNSTFIQKAIKVHGDKYDYSNVHYKNSKTKVRIRCKKCGTEFMQIPSSHLQGFGCKICSREKISNKQSTGFFEFKRRANKKHENRYKYIECNIRTLSQKVKIICPIHGVFEQSAKSHLRGSICPKCRKEKIKERLSLNKDEFIDRCTRIHNGKYDYSRTIYNGTHNKISIICPIHGEFTQVAGQHLHGYGCPMCSNKHKVSLKEFLDISNKVHGYKYDYSLVKFNTLKDKVDIICPKHGVFTQEAKIHINGSGCPICKSSKGEREIQKTLKKKGISYNAQYEIELENKLFSRNHLKVDFYIPDMKTIIEFNGIQHYKRVGFFHKTEEDFLMQLERDKRLKEYCKENNIKLIVIKYDQIDKIDEILTKKLNIK